MNTSKSKKKMPKLSVDEQMKKDLDNTKFLADWGFTGPNPNNCHRCGIHNSMIDGYMIQCAKCKLVYYCSMKCFNVDLEAHRQFCDSGMLHSDVERVKLFDLPRAPAEDPCSKEQAAPSQTQSLESPKTPRLLENTKAAVTDSPSAQNVRSPTKSGKKRASPKKNAKVKATQKKPLKTEPTDGIVYVDVAADTMVCTIPAPFASACTKVDSSPGELLPLPSGDGIDTEPTGVESIESTMITTTPETSALPHDEVKSPDSAVFCPATENGKPASESLSELPTESPHLSSETRMQPAPNEMQVAPVEKQTTTMIAPGLGEPTQSDEMESKTGFLAQSKDDLTTKMPSHSEAVLVSPQESRESSLHESDNANDPEILPSDSGAGSRGEGCPGEYDDDESSSNGAEQSPLRSSRVWSEDEDLVSGECQSQQQRLPSLDLSAISASDASVVSDAADGVETDRTPRNECEVECDGSDSTIIEYEEVLIEVQTCRASGSAEIASECDEAESESTESGDDGSDFSGNHGSAPLATEHVNETASSCGEEKLDESEGSNSTIVEYEEVIIEEDVYRTSGSKPIRQESYHPDASTESDVSIVVSSSSVHHESSADANSAARQTWESDCHLSEALGTSSCNDMDVSRSRTLLPPQTSGCVVSEVGYLAGDHQTRRQLQPLKSVAAHGRGDDDERSVLSDDESTGSDTTIIEYEEVIIDEEWWGVSGHVNCFDGIVYELSEDVIRRKSGSVNVAGNPSSEIKERSGERVRRFRLEGPTSTGRFFLRPIERESDLYEPALEVDADKGATNDSLGKTHNVKSDAHADSGVVGRRGHVSRGVQENQFDGSSRKLRVGEGSYLEEQKLFVPEVVDLKPVSPRSRPDHDSNDSTDHRVALRPTPPSPKQVPPERDPSFISKRSSLKEAPRAPPKSPSEMRDFSFIKKRSNLKETSPPPKKNLRPGGEHYLVFDKERKAYILRSLTGAEAADARDVVVLRPVKPVPKRQFEFEKPEWVKKSPIRNRGSLEGLLGQSFGNLGRSVADLNDEEPPSPRTPSRHEDCDDDQSLGSFPELGQGPTDAERSMDQSGETIHMLEDATQEEFRRPRAGRAVAGTRHSSQSNVVLRSSPNSPGSKKVESKLPSWAIKSPLRTTERGLMMKSFSDLSKLGNASFSTMPSSEQTFAKPSRKSSAAYKYVSPHRYKGDYMNSMATMIEANYETNEGDATDCKTLRSMPEL